MLLVGLGDPQVDDWSPRKFLLLGDVGRGGIEGSDALSFILSSFLKSFIFGDRHWRGKLDRNVSIPTLLFRVLMLTGVGCLGESFRA